MKIRIIGRIEWFFWAVFLLKCADFYRVCPLRLALGFLIQPLSYLEMHVITQSSRDRCERFMGKINFFSNSI
jgi:hypothetical protein